MEGIHSGDTDKPHTKFQTTADNQENLLNLWLGKQAKYKSYQHKKTGT